MTGKICIVTGANSGIGLETARSLATRGATVVLACRNKQKGEAALASLRSATNNNALHLMLVDLADMDSIRKMAAAFKQRFQQLDLLVNNAGAFMPARQTSVDGYELTFATNHLAYFLLTHLLLDLLIATPESRVVNVSSDAHRGGAVHFDDLQLKKGYGGYKAYAQSKLANILFSNELARRLDTANPTVNSLHPGVVATNFGSGKSGFFSFFFRIFSPFFLSPKAGAQTSIYLATSPEVMGVTGKYFDRSKPRTPSAAARDADAAKRLYEITAQLTGVIPIDDIQTSSG
ncbi:MAG: SDR family oxidoreductase [Bacteroidota bacterium]